MMTFLRTHTPYLLRAALVLLLLLGFALLLEHVAHCANPDGTCTLCNALGPALLFFLILLLTILEPAAGLLLQPATIRLSNGDNHRPADRAPPGILARYLR